MHISRAANLPENPGSVPTVSAFPERCAAESSLYWLLQSVGWLGFGVVMYAWAFAYWSPLVALLNKALLVAIGLLITVAFRPLFACMRHRGVAPASTGIIVLVVAFAAAPIWYELYAFLFRMLYPMISSTESAQARYLPGLVVPTQSWLYYGFVLTTWSLLYFLVHAFLELRSTKERAARAEALAATARLRVLQSQLEPHFLFNALNALSTLVVRGQLNSATEMIARIGDFLRVTLEVSDMPEIELTAELRVVQDYLAIEKVRFGDRLNYTIVAEQESLAALVPTLVLQPLVENAVRHAVLPRASGGCVSVSACRIADTLRLIVDDDGPGWPPGDSLPLGVGLKNSRQRLESLYAGAGRLETECSPALGARVVVDIPFHCAHSDFKATLSDL